MIRLLAALSCLLLLLALTAPDTVPGGGGDTKKPGPDPGKPAEKPSERLLQEVRTPRQVPIVGPGKIEFDPAYGVQRHGSEATSFATAGGSPADGDGVGQIQPNVIRSADGSLHLWPERSQ